MEYPIKNESEGTGKLKSVFIHPDKLTVALALVFILSIFGGIVHLASLSGSNSENVSLAPSPNPEASGLSMVGGGNSLLAGQVAGAAKKPNIISSKFGPSSPTFTPKPSPKPSNLPTTTPTEAPTPTPEPTSKPEPTNQPEQPTSILIPTSTPTPSPSPEPTPTLTVTPTP